MSSDSLAKIRKAIIDQDISSAVEFTKSCIADGIAYQEIIDVIANSLKEVGDLFECGDLFLPEVMRAAYAAKGSLEIVIPLALSKAGKEGMASKGRIAVGSLGPHDIGKMIVSSMLIADGFEIIDLGTLLTADKAEKLLKEKQADILALSILLTPDADKAAEIIRRARKISNGIKVMVGGAAMDKKTAERIGSDAYGAKAADAVALARKFRGII
jgi:methanogenic corrinoid protein MtbC1